MRDVPAGVPQRVIGRYALYGEIASGGMATVHFGRLLGPVGFSRTVAVKRLHPQFAKDPEFVSMFLDEARVAARIQHPNVVATLDVVAMSGELFLVMEYVAGESLARIQRTLRARGERLPPRVVGAIGTNLLFGLHAAHEASSERGEPLGIVHRDVSPQNLLVGIDGVGRILDFGVAKAAGRIQVTRDGQVKGKLAYMPPEQLAGSAVDRRADVYAAAVVIWEALTGQRLFDGENQSVVLAQALTAEVEPPGKIVPGLPSGVDDVIMRGLSRRVELRFESAHEMAVALEETLGVETPRRVGELVHQIASDSLAAKAARVKEIESLDSDSAVELMRASHEGAALHPGLYPTPQLSTFHDQAQPAVPVPVVGALAPAAPAPIGEGSGVSRVSSVSVSLPGEPRRPVWALAAIGAGLALGAIVFVWTLRGPSPPTASPAPANAVPPAEPLARDGAASPSADLAPVATALAEAAPDSAPSAAPDASAPASASASSPRTPPRAQPPAAARRPPPARPPAGGCDPPYTIDATGKRKLKPQCI